MIGLHEGGGKKTARVKAAPEHAIVLRLTVHGCRPPIWRELLVRESMWLSQLHDSIQIAFDWFDYQTHVFAFGDVRYGNPLKEQKDGEEKIIVGDDRDVTLAEVSLASRELFMYSYNFGEGWRIAGAIKELRPLAKGVRYPQCLGGERAGPPEDCGGLEAYHDMLACLKEPHTDLGREWREWLGPEFDPERCDLETINKALRKLRR